MVYYAVAKGRQVGIVDSWEDCQQLISGFSGAVYKKFPTEQQAREFILEHQPHQLRPTHFTAWVDGSYSPDANNYSSGILVKIQNTTMTFEKGFIGNNPEHIEFRNVAGELYAVLWVLELCQMYHQEEVTIHYDYEGIEKWARDQWKANNSLTQMYKRKVKESGIEIQFVKVKAHSGQPENEKVDQLAKQALG